LSGPVLLIIGLVIGAIALLALAWKNNWGDIQGKTEAVVDWLREKIGLFIKWMKDFWDEHGEKILEVVNALWDGVMKVFTYYKEQIQRVFELFRLAFEGDWEGFGKKLREIWDEAWKFMKEAFKIIGETIITMAFNLGVAIGQKIRDIDWIQLGKDIILGIINGLMALERKLGDTAIGIATGLFDIFKGFFGISSPSRLMEQMIGANIGAGIQSGLMKSIKDLKMNVTAGLPTLAREMVPAHYAVAGGGGRPVVVNFNSPIYFTDEYELERIISPIMERAIREEKSLG
jgi:phage-related protein